ncbi:hypothetical protein IQ255_01840 [Pleurocapsales cyanobacterium LEGE 10410]|nr:hypothetical protein [Pleurocapsales cyanobacterium LEGE 10410]
MLTFNIFQLTPEQQASISIYRHKWQQIARSTAPIDREQAKLAIKRAYELIELSEPKIIFFTTPDAALKYIHNEIINNWGKLADTALGSPVAYRITEILGNIRSQVKAEILEQLGGNLDDGLADRIASQAADRLEENQLFSIIWANFGDMAIASAKDSDTDELSKAIFKLFFEAGFVFNNYISYPLWQAQRQINSFLFNKPPADNNMNQMFSMLFAGNFQQGDKYQLPIIDVTSRSANVIVPSVIADYAYYIDYFAEVLNCDRDRIKWDIFYHLIVNCGWIFPYKKTVLVCDRNFVQDTD